MTNMERTAASIYISRSRDELYSAGGWMRQDLPRLLCFDLESYGI